MEEICEAISLGHFVLSCAPAKPHVCRHHTHNCHGNGGSVYEKWM